MKAIIIGAGLIGLSTAHFLAKSGCSVTVIDRRDGPGLETSFANAGLITESLAAPWSFSAIAGLLWKSMTSRHATLRFHPQQIPALIAWGRYVLQHQNRLSINDRFLSGLRLVRYSKTILDTISPEVSREFHYNRTGLLAVYRDEKEFKTAQAGAAALDALNIPSKVLDRDQTLVQEPMLSTTPGPIFGGIEFPDEAHGDSYKFCRWLYQSCLSQGVKFLFDTSVKELIERGGKVTALQTNADHLRDFDVCVLCAGSYSPALIKPLRLKLPFYPVKGYSLTLDLTKAPHRPKHPVLDNSLHLALTPLGNRLRVAGLAEFAGHDTTFNTNIHRSMLDMLKQVYPTLLAADHSNICNQWCGLRPMSADSLPIMGPTPIKNLWVNTGHGALGWSMAAGAGKSIADLVITGKADLDLSDYTINRFL